MKFHKTFLLVLVLLALPITASAYTITWDNLNSNPDVLVTATGGDLQTKTGDGGHTAVGISGGVDGEINLGEAMTFAFSSSQDRGQPDLGLPVSQRPVRRHGQ